jgi:O-antigen/teichoic acid export membrane protein
MKFDIVSNFAAAAFVAVVTFVFTPIYVRYLGVEAYGLIGVLAALQGSLGLLDLGLSQVIARETARYLERAISTQSIKNLLRSVETVAFVIACLATLMIVLPAHWIATGWLKADDMHGGQILSAIRLMGVLVGLRLLESVFRGAAIGLHRQSGLNLITVFFTAARAFGALGIFVYVSTSIEALFIWQVIISILNLGALVALIYSSFDEPGVKGVFSFRELRTVARFSAGITVGSILGILLLQSDKLLLSKLLQLREFGEYSLAATLAAAPHLFAAPIAQAVQPRFARAFARSDMSGLALTFHGSSQLISVSVGAAGIVVIFFSGDILSLWLKDPVLSSRISALTSVLALGSLFNGMMWMPSALQLAYGWTGLTVRATFVSVILVVPLLLIVVPRYGAIGAACVWVLLNFGSFAITSHFMFRKIIPSEKMKWYLSDVSLPLAASTIVVLLLKVSAPVMEPYWLRLLFVLFVSAAALVAATLAAPIVRLELFSAFAILWKRVVSQ